MSVGADGIMSLIYIYRSMEILEKEIYRKQLILIAALFSVIRLYL